MSPESIRLVQESWQKLAPHGESVAAAFYDRLFNLDPQLRRLFRSGSMDEQGRKLAAALAMVIGCLGRMDEVIPVVEAIGRRHAGYGVEEAHYRTFGAAFISTLEKAMGDAFTPEVGIAWMELYGTLSTVMKRAADGAHPLRSLARHPERLMVLAH
jgi:hemoglobin-like flavoprotein